MDASQILLPGLVTHMTRATYPEGRTRASPNTGHGIITVFPFATASPPGLSKMSTEHQAASNPGQDSQPRGGELTARGRAGDADIAALCMTKIDRSGRRRGARSPTLAGRPDSTPGRTQPALSSRHFQPWEHIEHRKFILGLRPG